MKDIRDLVQYGIRDRTYTSSAKEFIQRIYYLDLFHEDNYEDMDRRCKQSRI